ncbi:MAG: radical SAM protein [Pseudomonadota bacterium]
MRPFFKDDFAALVPDAHRWVSRWVAACDRLDLPLRRTTLADGALHMVMDRAPGTWTAVLRPAGDQRGWRTVAGFVLAYEGLTELDGATAPVLDRLARILERFAPHLPDRFEGFAFVGRREDDPVAALRTMFPFATVERSRQDHGEVLEVLVRTTSRCNQRCPFCSGPEHDLPESDMVRACVEAAGRWLPGCMVSLTGGEPTLKPSFPGELDAALAAPGVNQVQVQTNAVGFARRVDPASIPASDRLTFFVSLHGVDPGIYDECTGTTRQLDDALKGLDRILGAGHQVIVNTVITSANLEHLPAMAEFLADRYPVGGASTPRIGPWTGLPQSRPVWHFSVLICPDRSPEAAAYLVEYRRLVPVVEAVQTQARDLGLEVQSLLSSTHASVPPCAVPPAHRAAGRSAPELAATETGYEDPDRPWVKSNRCRTCREDPRCLGVPAPYARRFGLDGLEPIPENEY